MEQTDILQEDSVLESHPLGSEESVHKKKKNRIRRKRIRSERMIRKRKNESSNTDNNMGISLNHVETANLQIKKEEENVSDDAHTIKEDLTETNPVEEINFVGICEPQMEQSDILQEESVLETDPLGSEVTVPKKKKIRRNRTRGEKNQRKKEKRKNESINTPLQPVEQVHEKTKPFKCDICDLSFLRKLSLTEHVSLVHENKKSFKCDICGARFREYSHMKTHIAFLHEDRKCDTCKVGFVSQIEFNAHMISHENPNGKTCIICHSSFSSRYNLLNHMILVHKEIKLFKCDVCEKRFKRKEDLQKHKIDTTMHIDLVHEENKLVKCKGKSSGKVNLQKHVKSVHERKKLAELNQVQPIEVKIKDEDIGLENESIPTISTHETGVERYTQTLEKDPILSEVTVHKLFEGTKMTKGKKKSEKQKLRRKKWKEEKRKINKNKNLTKINEESILGT